ncbi:MAG: acetolactate synthase 2 catalytic subunit [Candidatus Melainabacteria bacterium]|nr:MAG: acetolactate synthase 2 catalytic subunit [Candidatus Melainabacteria bacterium]
MKGAQVLIEALEREGVDCIFGYPGGAIMPVYDALVDANLRHILFRHEQGAALAADGYARVTGKVGVCLATSGPGATNLVTGLANSFMDSVPVVAITGQVATSHMGTDAFQEVDIFGISMPVVKHSYIIRDAASIPTIIHEAFEIANSGRPGPVLIDLPKDVANAVVENVRFFEIAKAAPEQPQSDQLAIARDLIAKSRRPLVYAGGGTRIARASREVREFVETTGIPIVTTLQGLGCISGKHPLFLGMLGMHGTKNANMAVQESDLLICVGARFDDRVTGKLAEFAPHAKIIHMDIDPAEIGKLRRVQCAIQGDIKTALANLAVPTDIDEWVAQCKANKETYAWRYDNPTEKVYAPKFIKELSDRAAANTIITCDVGQHQMWVAQHYQFDSPNNHLTSGGLGTMGFGLPAAIGAHFANPQSQVINMSGDGSFMINVQELATIKRYSLPVKVVIFDNQALGMVRQWQELFHEERYSEVSLHDNPNFVRLAEAFDIPGMEVRQASEIDGAIERLLNEKGPLLVHVHIDPKDNVWPLVPPGKSNSQMMEAKPNAKYA